MSIRLGEGCSFNGPDSWLRSWYGYRVCLPESEILESECFANIYRCAVRELRSESASRCESGIGSWCSADIEYGMLVEISDDGMYWKATWFPLSRICTITTAVINNHVEVCTERRS